MRNIHFAAVALFACICVNAQGQKQLDSLRYIFSEFRQGTVIFADKQINHGVLNISPLDQAVYCLSPESDTLYVQGPADIISVSVSGRSFIRWNGSFVEIVTKESDTGVGIIRSTSKVSNVKTGAYGMSSATSSMRSYSVDATTGTLSSLIIDDPRNYVYRKSTCLVHKGKCIPLSKKSFEKMFPGKKEYIESVWPDLNLMSAEPDAVLAFYYDLLQN